MKDEALIGVTSILCVTILVLFFWGEPDLMRAVIAYLGCRS